MIELYSMSNTALINHIDTKLHVRTCSFKTYNTMRDPVNLYLGNVTYKVNFHPTHKHLQNIIISNQKTILA